MKPQLYKTGVVNTSEILEFEGTSLVYTSNQDKNLVFPYSYTPAADTNNTSLRKICSIVDNNVLTPTTVIRIILDVSWSGFDTSSTAGTFNIYWNTWSITRADGSTVWVANPFVDALNEQQSLKTLVLSSESGIYRYNTTLTMTQTYIDTYAWSGIGLRTDYSNGVGTISIDKAIVIYDKYSITENIKERIGKDYILTQEFIEI